MNKTAVSVIMPVYGVEKYLENAINSVLKQTFEDFELILVDDKSPDNCPLICDSFKEKDSRIRVIHKGKNEGLGFARNTGLEEAHGEFIYFMDSDDYIENDLLEKTISAVTEKTEFVIFGVNRVYEDKNGNITKTEKLTPEKMSVSCHKETADIFAMLNREKVFPFAWNKLYRKSFLDRCNAKFEKTKLIEDFLFNISLFSKASHINVIPDNLYNYRKPAHETLVSSYAPEFFDLCKRKYTLEKEYLEGTGASDSDKLQLIYFSYVKHLISVFIKNRSPKAGLSVGQQIKKIDEALNDEMTKDVLKSYIPVGGVMKILTVILQKKLSALCWLVVVFGSRFI